MRLAGKTVVVTGAGGGLGRVLAVGVAREGADVVVHDHVYMDEAAKVAEAVRALGRRALLVEADIARRDRVDAMFAEVRREFGGVSALVNNAGVTMHAPTFETTEADFDRVLSVNVKGTFFCTVAAARQMRAGGGGSIVNVSTICAELGVRNLVAYATSKGAIQAMTKQLAVELAPFAIRVNAMGPGPILIDRTRREDPDYERTWGDMTPLGRVGLPEDLVGPVVFLASDESRYMTGQVFFVDGGWTAQGKTPLSAIDLDLARGRRPNE